MFLLRVCQLVRLLSAYSIHMFLCACNHIYVYLYIYIMSSFGNQVPQNPITGLHINMVILRYLPMFRIAHIFCVKK